MKACPLSISNTWQKTLEKLLLDVALLLIFMNTKLMENYGSTDKWKKFQDLKHSQVDKLCKQNAKLS